MLFFLRFGVDANHCNERKESALHNACAEGSLEIVKILIKVKGRRKREREGEREEREREREKERERERRGERVRGGREKERERERETERKIIEMSIVACCWNYNLLSKV
jgi:hypothetical protein